MMLSVIIDEAAAFGDIMGTKEALSRICQELKGIATDVRLIVAGTGFDQVAMSLSSSTDVFKYRMQPWDGAKLKWAAEKRTKEDASVAEMCLEAIGKSPILRQLITMRVLPFLPMKLWLISSVDTARFI
jgi:hypothetical protein